MTPLNAPRELLKTDYRYTDPGSGGTLQITKQFGVLPIVTATAEARTIAAPPKSGLFLFINMVTAGGTATITVLDQAGATTYTLTATTAGYWAMLFSVRTSATNLAWNVLQLYGMTGASSSVSGAATMTTMDVSGVSNFAGACNFAAGGTIGADLTMADNKNFVINATTGSRFGTASTAKIGFWNVTPVVQPAGVTGLSANLGLGASGNPATVYVLNTTNFSGGVGTKNYTVGDVVLALKQAGILATS
jgi:hypothetical protein